MSVEPANPDPLEKKAQALRTLNVTFDPKPYKIVGHDPLIRG